MLPHTAPSVQGLKATSVVEVVGFMMNCPSALQVWVVSGQHDPVKLHPDVHCRRIIGVSSTPPYIRFSLYNRSHHGWHQNCGPVTEQDQHHTLTPCPSISLPTHNLMRDQAPLYFRRGADTGAGHVIAGCPGYVGLTERPEPSDSDFRVGRTGLNSGDRASSSADKTDGRTQQCQVP
jgi:hypothetical protein